MKGETVCCRMTMEHVLHLKKIIEKNSHNTQCKGSPKQSAGRTEQPKSFES